MKLFRFPTDVKQRNMYGSLPLVEKRGYQMLLLDFAVYISYQVRQYTTNIIFDTSMSNFAGAPSRQLHHPNYVPSKFSHAI